MENGSRHSDIAKNSAIILSGMMKSERYKTWTEERMVARSIELAKELAGNGEFRTK